MSCVEHIINIYTHKSLLTECISMYHRIHLNCQHKGLQTITDLKVSLLSLQNSSCVLNPLKETETTFLQKSLHTKLI